jgi:hypothetical protein
MKMVPLGFMVCKQVDEQDLACYESARNERVKVLSIRL